jgi:hypothetical protein
LDALTLHRDISFLLALKSAMPSHALLDTKHPGPPFLPSIAARSSLEGIAAAPVLAKIMPPTRSDQ